MVLHCAGSGKHFGSTSQWSSLSAQSSWGTTGSNTAQHRFGPLMLIATWHKGEDSLLYVITNTHNFNAALLLYSWRFWIEALFADFKGRGFRLAHTKIRHPQRLSRLLLAASIAFLWALAVGSFVFHSPQQRAVDRSFFSAGLSLPQTLFQT